MLALLLEHHQSDLERSSRAIARLRHTNATGGELDELPAAERITRAREIAESNVSGNAVSSSDLPTDSSKVQTAAPLREVSWGG